MQTMVDNIDGLVEMSKTSEKNLGSMTKFPRLTFISEMIMNQGIK